MKFRLPDGDMENQGFEKCPVGLIWQLVVLDELITIMQYDIQTN